MEDKVLKKGDYLVEESFELMDFVERINKLSYHDFPIDQVLNLLESFPLFKEVLDPYIFFSDVRYTRNLIHKTPDFELVLMCWAPGQHSPIHGHADEKVWLRVEDGSLHISRFQEEPHSSQKSLSRVGDLDVQKGFIDGPVGIHKIENKSQHNAISLHLYAKPLSECTIYDDVSYDKKSAPLSYHSIHGKLVGPEDKR